MRTVTLEEHFTTPEFVKATAHLQSASRSGFVEVVRASCSTWGKAGLPTWMRLASTCRYYRW